MSKDATRLLAEVNAFGETFRENFGPMEPGAFTHLILEFLEPPNAPKLALAKLRATLNEVLEVSSPSGYYRQHLQHITLHGVQGEWEEDILERLKDRGLVEVHRDSLGVVSRPSTAIPRTMDAFGHDSVQAFGEMVRMLQRESIDDLIELAYNVAMRRDIPGPPFVQLHETGRPIVAHSLAHNLFAYGKFYLPAPGSCFQPQGEQEVHTDQLWFDNGMTCLKDGTRNGLLCLAGLSFLELCGYPAGRRLQNLLALLSCYYSRAKVQAHKLGALGSDFRARNAQKETLQAIGDEAQQFRAEAKELETISLPTLRRMVNRLEDLHLVRTEGVRVLPLVSQVRLLEGGEAVNVGEIAANARACVSLLARGERKTPWHPPQSLDFYPRVHPLAPLVQAARAGRTLLSGSPA